MERASQASLARGPGASPRSHSERGLRAPAPLVASLLALAAVCALLAGCSFQPGGDQIAWQTGDQLWVANADGSGARLLAPREVAGFSWSPDHHELAFRFGPTASPAPAGATWAAAETPSDIAIVSISGGAATQISPNNHGLARSDAWWDPNGNRLLYREYGVGAPLSAVYYDSQNDQPVGIARKVVLNAASLPTLSPDGMRVAVIDPSGAVRVGPPAQSGSVVARDATLTLPGTGRPARLLWRPGHDQLVYPTTGNGADATTLRLLDLATKRDTPITSLTDLLDAAFSPDGSLLLLHTSNGLLIWPVNGPAPRGVIAENDPLAQAFWSPDSRWLLVADSAGLRLYSAASGWRARATLSYTAPLSEPSISAGTPWRPATANPWRADGSAFVFASPSGFWQDTGRVTLNPRQAGIYVERMGASGPSGAPSLIASGNVSSPSWGASDPSTVLLTPALA